MKSGTMVVLAGLWTLPMAAFTAEAEPQGTMAMHGHMEKMQAMMAEIGAEQDTEKRHALMEQHHAAMKAGMGMMADGGATEGMPMEQRMESMEQRMGMMRMMMEQMLQHEEAEATGGPEDPGTHQH